jgi:glycosyltransferase involved in cell wall biosynthesis
VNLPRVSIVIPSFNQGQYIERTLLSIIKQNYDGEIEIIVSDGGSTDNTIEVLNKYNDRIIWWSEKDNGFADAVNKGFHRASGEIYAIQSSDDYYLKGSFNKLISCLIANKDAVLICGREALQEQNGFIFGGYELPVIITPKSFLLDHPFPGIFQHTTFFRREYYERVGGMRPEFDMCADADLFYRMLHFGNGCFLNEYTAVYQRHQTQRTQTQTLKFEGHLIGMVDSCNKDQFYNSQHSLTKKEYFIFTQFIKLFYLQLSDKESALKEARQIVSRIEVDKRTSDLANQIINQPDNQIVHIDILNYQFIRIIKRLFKKYILRNHAYLNQKPQETFSEKIQANWWKDLL